jgi:hypothetical protein
MLLRIAIYVTAFVLGISIAELFLLERDPPIVCDEIVNILDNDTKSCERKATVHKI